MSVEFSVSSAVASSIAACQRRDSVRYSALFPGVKSELCVEKGKAKEREGDQSENSDRQTRDQSSSVALLEAAFRYQLQWVSLHRKQAWANLSFSERP